MYEAHFGLAESPFHIAPDLRFYVEAAPHRAAVQALRDSLARGDEFMLLTGDFGAGKTIVARRLFDDFPRERDRIGVLSGQRIEGDDLFDRIAEAFAVEDFEKRHPLVALTRVLEGYGREGRDALLVIDEAHRLDVHSLRRLRKLTGVRLGRRGVLHVALVGRHPPPGIAELEKIGRPLHVGTTVMLGALDEEGTRDYVLQRLARAGWTGRPSFDDEALAELHARCAGNPGRINRLCGHVLLQLSMKNLDIATAGFVRAVDELIAAELDDDGEPPRSETSSNERADGRPSTSPGPAATSGPASHMSIADSGPPPGSNARTEPPPTSAFATGAQSPPLAADMPSALEPGTEVPESAARTATPGAATHVDIAVPLELADEAPVSPIDLDVLRVEPRDARLAALHTDAPEILHDARPHRPPQAGARGWLLQSLAAVVIFVCGGVAWEAVSTRLAAKAAVPTEARTDHAAGSAEASPDSEMRDDARRQSPAMQGAAMPPAPVPASPTVDAGPLRDAGIAPAVRRASPSTTTSPGG